MSFLGAVRASVSAALLVLPALLGGPFVSPAAAAPILSDDQPEPTNLTLPWTVLGLNPSMVLGPNASTGVSVPIPAGLTAARLQGTIEAPTNISPGYLQVDDANGRFVAAVFIPPAGPDRLSTPFDVDISSTRGPGASLDLSLAFHPIERGDEICATQQVTLDNLSTVYTGTEAPMTSVASFFPSVLKGFTVFAPADADTAEKQTVLTLVASLERLYHPQPLAITVLNQPRGALPPPSAPLTRTIVVESGIAGINVENPGSPAAFLRIAGRGDSLTAQTSLLVNQLQTLVQSPVARVDQAGSVPALQGDTLTFSQLKMTGRTDALRTGSMTVGVDRASLGGGRVDGAQVHLLADYTPVAKDDAAAVMIRSKGVVVYRAPLDNSGRLDVTFDVPRQAIGQWLNLDFALTFTPSQVCNPLQANLTFQVDPRSTLTLRRGGQPLEGFGAVPSEFSPGFMVALDGGNPNQLAYAARIVAAIARMTPAQLTPQLVDLKTAADAQTGALIVASSAALKQTSLSPPVGGDGAAVDFNLPDQLRANINDGLGSIQAFADRPRNRSVVLVTTTASWTLVDPLFSYLDGLTGGWSQLSGDVLAAGVAGTPTIATIRQDGSTFEPPPPHKTNKVVLGGIGVGVVVAIAIVAATLWSGRRRNAAVAPPTHEPPTTPE
ncbi:hypothetical protein [Mycolicibacterium sp.]|uniref:hypothetical protein n=1 Tax=Mycolicibacterium sp. TaxID=2320850 RepID=UPI0037C9F0E1